ncbi:sialate O-acetylesterase [Flavobacterium agrisoli]|uniref:9-O-acetylesterase n=1 Tax=Flavobacterium agrisoli TaxID=2793066 RepID=A0A934PJH9_9FLAO|nr:sialate O-acetylesterase [Flavobacterium agrisoli]MBK0369281.1 9-O-acetylesterase [Flavobacterium agrisoli]
MKFLNKSLILIALFWQCCLVKAQIKLPALVSDNMVLQQNSKVNLWGWASPNEKISIRVGWQKEAIETKADEKGNWKVATQTPKASQKTYEITLTASNKITLHNVLIGEVWICSGQSNMFFPVGKQPGTWKNGVVNYEEELQKATFPSIRLFTVNTVASDKPLNDVQGNWQECNPTSVANFSAVGYFFGKELYQDLKVPIGLISSSWGGTKAEAWTAEKVLTENKELLPILEENASKEKKYYSDLETYYVNLKNATGNELKKPKRDQENKYPYVLYNGMLHPLTNFTIKGAIWYQGESNAETAFRYQTLFSAMVASWRTEWNQGVFPFYYVQIAPHKGQNPEIREAQLRSLQTIPNSGMVVTTDVGDANDIHPRNKQTVGYRLGLWARAKTYNESKLVFSGPLYKEMKIQKQQIQLFFDHADSGLKKEGKEVKEFEIAGDDRVFYPATAKIKGNSVMVSSDKVKKPVAVRFAWKKVPEPNLFNAENLPASPFRTDNWETSKE